MAWHHPPTIGSYLTHTSSDAISFYPNIDTQHTLGFLEHFLSSTSSPQYAQVILEATYLLKENHVFQFSDTFLEQLNGTAKWVYAAGTYVRNTLL